MVATVARRLAFTSEKIETMKGPSQFWKFRCRKTARHCGTKGICKSKCKKHEGFGRLLEVRMSKKCPTDEIDRSIDSQLGS